MGPLGLSSPLAWDDGDGEDGNAGGEGAAYNRRVGKKRGGGWGRGKVGYYGGGRRQYRENKMTWGEGSQGRKKVGYVDGGRRCEDGDEGMVYGSNGLAYAWY